jgi:hypothetical protein
MSAAETELCERYTVVIDGVKWTGYALYTCANHRVMSIYPGETLERAGAEILIDQQSETIRTAIREAARHSCVATASMWEGYDQ